VVYVDLPQVRAIVRDAGAENYRFSSIVMGIVTSDAFSKTKVQAQALPVHTLTTRTEVVH